MLGPDHTQHLLVVMGTVPLIRKRPRIVGSFSQLQSDDLILTLTRGANAPRARFLEAVAERCGIRMRGRTEGAFMFRFAQHWPKAVIAIGVLLTVAWMVFLGWLLVHAFLGATWGAPAALSYQVPWTSTPAKAPRAPTGQARSQYQSG